MSSGMLVSCCYLDRELKKVWRCNAAHKGTLRPRGLHSMKRPFAEDLPCAKPRSIQTAHSARRAWSPSPSRRGTSQALSSRAMFQSKTPQREWEKFLIELGGHWLYCWSAYCFVKETSTVLTGRKKMKSMLQTSSSPSFHVPGVFWNVIGVVCTLI